MGGKADILIGGLMLYYTLLPDGCSDDDYKKIYSDIAMRLPEFRRSRAEHIIPAKERAVSALSFFLLCHALSSEYHCFFSAMKLSDIGKAIGFSYSASGKPSLIPPYDSIHFNISHCRNAIACGTAPFELGIDIQDIRMPSSAVVKRFMPSANEPRSNDVFTNPMEFSMLWSRYEAFVKLTGDGITRSFSDCECLADDFLERTGTSVASTAIPDHDEKKTAAYLSAAFSNTYSHIFSTEPVQVDFSSLLKSALL